MTNIDRGSLRFHCPAAGKCGGCQLTHLSYGDQLRRKQQHVQHLLKGMCEVSPIIGMDDPYHYRNKVHAVIAEDRQDRPYAGVYAAGTHSVVPVKDCLIEDRRAGRIIQTIVEMMPRYGIRAYNEDRRTGYLRHVLIRTGSVTGEIMVTLVAASLEFPGKKHFVAELRRLHPEITTLILNRNDKRTSMVLGQRQKTVFGAGYMEDVLCGKRFRISPQSFYQVNARQTEILYCTAIAMMRLTGRETLLDAYCGTGTIGLCAADHLSRLIGVELNADAVRDAQANARLNGVRNAVFTCDDAGRFMTRQAQEGRVPDVVCMDPPRSGSDEKFLRALLTLKPPRIVYVSCNPETLARDLKTLLKGGYCVEAAVPVDMFPGTMHVETVVCLSRQVNVHNMNLHSSPFEMIKSGKKTIELRLFDEKRQRIKAGDKIVFTNTATGETLSTTVVKLHCFDRFEELYSALPLLQCGYTAENVDHAKPSDMEQYYSAEQQEKYGVVGIELRRPEGMTDGRAAGLARS